jgi:hypothetical protein
MENKDFVEYQEALELKGLGYPQNNCFAWYAHDGLHHDSEYIEGDFTYSCCVAPTYSQAFRWFREQHNIHSYIDILKRYNEKSLYDYVIVSDDIEEDTRRWKTYEDAELECLRELIEIVKNGK